MPDRNPGRPQADSLPRRILAAAPIAAALALIATLLFAHLGIRELRGDEGLYSLVVADLLRGESGLRLTHEGRHYLNKPPLAFYAMGLSAAVRGLDETALRLPAATASFLLMALVLKVAHRRAGAWCAALGCLIVVASPRFLGNHGLRSAVTEPWLLLFTLAAVLAWARARPRGSGAVLRAVFPWILAGALTKGPVGPALVGLTLLLGELLLPPPTAAPGPPSEGFRRRLLAPVLLASAGLASHLAWWLWNYPSLAQLAKFLRRDWIQRATGDLQKEHLQGPFFFLDRIAGDIGWWLLLLVPALLPAVWRRLRREGDAEGLALRLLPLLTLLVFSLSSSKLVWYCYPAYPAIAILMAEGLAEVCRTARARAWLPGLIVVALLVPLAPRLDRAWKMVRWAPANTLTQLALLAERQPGAAVYADLRLSNPDHLPREWNRFALTYRLRALPWPHDARLPEGECRYFVSPAPESAPALAGLPAPARQVATQPGRDPELWVVDLCRDEFGRRLVRP